MKTQLTKRIAGLMLVMAMIATLCAFGAMTVSAGADVKQSSLTGTYTLGTAATTANVIELKNGSVLIGVASTGPDTVTDASASLKAILGALKATDKITFADGKVTAIATVATAGPYDFTSTTLVSALKEVDINVSTVATSTVKLVKGNGTLVLESGLESTVNPLLKSGDIIEITAKKLSKVTLKDSTFTYDLTSLTATELNNPYTVVAAGAEEIKLKTLTAAAFTVVGKTTTISNSTNSIITGLLKANADTIIIDGDGKIIEIGLNDTTSSPTNSNYDLSTAANIKALKGVLIKVAATATGVIIPQELAVMEYDGYNTFSDLIDILQPKDIFTVDVNKLVDITLKSKTTDYDLTEDTIMDLLKNTATFPNTGKLKVSGAKSVKIPQELTAQYILGVTAISSDATLIATNTALTDSGKIAAGDTFTINGSNKITSIELKNSAATYDYSLAPTAAQAKGVVYSSINDDGDVTIKPASAMEITVGGTNSIIFDISALVDKNNITVNYTASTPVSYKLVTPAANAKYVSGSTVNGFITWPEAGGTLGSGKKASVASNEAAGSLDYIFESKAGSLRMGVTEDFTEATNSNGKSALPTITGTAGAKLKVDVITTKTYTLKGIVGDATAKTKQGKPVPIQTTGNVISLYLTSDYNKYKDNLDELATYKVKVTNTAIEVDSAATGAYAIPDSGDIVAGEYTILVTKGDYTLKDPTGDLTVGYITTAIPVTVSDKTKNSTNEVIKDIALRTDTISDFRRAHKDALALSTETIKVTDKAIVEAALAAYNKLSTDDKGDLIAEKALLDELLNEIPRLEAEDAAAMIEKGLGKTYVNDNVVTKADAIVKAKYSGFTVTLKSVDLNDIISDEEGSAGTALKQGTANVEITVAKSYTNVDVEATTNSIRVIVATILDYNTETVAAAGSMEGASIDLTEEKLILPAIDVQKDAEGNAILDADGNEVPVYYTALAYSIDGGQKWKAAKADTFSDAKFAKLLKKDMELWVSDKAIDKSTKQPAEGANIIKFPKTNKRPKLDKYVVNYSVFADKTGASAGWWVLTEKGGSTAVKAGIEIAATNGKVPNGDGYGTFYDVTSSNDNQDPGIPVLTGKKATYLIRSAAKKEADGSYTAASAPKKLSVAGLQKAPKYKVAKGGVSYKANTWIADGTKAPVLMTEKGTFTSATGTTIDVWMAGTEKKPASAKQTLTVPASN